MKRILFFILLLGVTAARGQSKCYYAVSLTDQCTAFPFAKALGLFKEPMHPGFEVLYGKVIREKNKHDWIREYHAGYFYHRFLQHGIPLYIQYAYRYKFTTKFSADAALGAGYFHSIAATEVLKKNANGDYHPAKGIGRPQGMAAFTLGAGYHFKWMSKRPFRLFLNYQVRLQAPFVKSYVPILPYTQAAIGVTAFLNNAKK